VKIVVDASVVLAALLPEEPQQAIARHLLVAHVDRQVELIGPALLPHEVTNGMLVSARRGRIPRPVALEMLAELGRLDITYLRVGEASAFETADRYCLSAYDASYVALAAHEEVMMVTADARLLRAVRPHLPWVISLAELSGRLTLGDAGLDTGDTP
jgi:predicted nucleic acid-binding protein